MAKRAAAAVAGWDEENPAPPVDPASQQHAAMYQDEEDEIPELSDPQGPRNFYTIQMKLALHAHTRKQHSMLNRKTGGG